VVGLRQHSRDGIRRRLRDETPLDVRYGPLDVGA
jgi:hypothetical protein